MYAVTHIMKIFSAATLFLLLVSGGDDAYAMGGKPGVPRISIDGQAAVLSSMFLGSLSAFMKIHNTGTADDILMNARVNIPGAVVELHNVRDGRMIRVERIQIPSGATTVLKPGGLHIMMFQLPKDVAEGTEITLILKFEQSGEKQIPVVVRKSGNASAGHTH